MLEFFKGYLRTRGKEPIDKFNNAKTLDEVKDCESYCGVLADNMILIDIDDAEQAEVLMGIVEGMQIDCIVRQTSRGKHFLFKNSDVESCGHDKTLACGLKADIKVGSRNSTQQLKLNGEERFIEWECDEPEELPKWLHPVNTNANFMELEEGDGRNSTLYGYILNLTTAGFSKDESRKTLEIINKYILKEPLGEDELQLITRDEAFPEEVFFQKNRFMHNSFASFLKNNDHIVRINGQMSVYREGAYVGGAREIEGKMIHHIPILKAAQRTEVLRYLDIICEETPAAPPNLIAFNNGVYDIATDTLMPFSPDIVITNKIPWDYEQEAYSELADKTMNKLACNDEAIRALLEECIGYCFYRRNELSKAFVLTGDKSNGKSTFLDMVKNLLGQFNYSALDLGELDERFSTATMAGKLANIGDDISDDFLQGRSISTFKKIVSGNQIKAENKNDPNIFFMKPIVKLLFSANDVPRMKDKTGAVLRRLVIIPFNATFSKSDPDFDPYITWKLMDEAVMKYLVQLGIQGLKRVITNNAFSESEKVTKELQEYEMNNNPILLYLQDTQMCEIENQPTKEVHKAYQVFCVENGFNSLTLSNFSKEINRRLGMTTKRLRINGQLTSIYTKDC